MFILSKVVGLLTDPTNLVVLILVAATILLWTRHARVGRVVLVAECLTLAVVAVLPLEEWLLAPLEDRFPISPPPETIDGLIVLGGAIDPVISVERGQPSADGAIDRLIALVDLGRRYPQARIIFTGGSGSLTEQRYKEAPVVKEFLAQIGFDASRVEFEDQSRNTRENATLTQAMANPQPGQKWLLVTSAMHMPRSVGVFRGVGWTVTPWPVDFHTTGHPTPTRFRFHIAGGLSVLGTALHEWIGLLSYHALGWSDELFPGPMPL
jgi:uncharacterized SAM-binding protein YcdF (DUF218 family)